jgi:hypothetical protein
MRIIVSLTQGGRHLGQQAGVAIALDSVWVVLFALYLAASGRAQAA